MTSPLVYTCDKSCFEERDNNRIKNRMCKRALPEEMNCMTQKDGQGENEDTNGIQVFFFCFLGRTYGMIIKRKTTRPKENQ